MFSFKDFELVGPNSFFELSVVDFDHDSPARFSAATDLSQTRRRNLMSYLARLCGSDRETQ